MTPPRVDGAGWWGQLRNVTIPLISPVLFYNIVLGTIGVLQYFLVPLVLNSGDGRPAGTTFFFNVLIYKTFFTFQDMSAGATAGLVPVPHHPGAYAGPVLERAATGSITPGRRARWPPSRT